jgi:hypothetical protein
VRCLWNKLDGAARCQYEAVASMWVFVFVRTVHRGVSVETREVQVLEMPRLTFIVRVFFPQL